MLVKKDLLKRWGISLRTLDRWIKYKGVPCKKLICNGRIYFDEREIEEWEKQMGLAEMIGNHD